ncbi:MAG TPA: serine/threonine-protein phosphatase [Pasteurellaceae bacterium]|nr:serine/threonine-protein phosphatase [Pasteurellaceae bacterium]
MAAKLYKKIDASKYANIYVVGDLHGCYDLLMQELASKQFNFEQDLLISVGDLIDRGPKSLECLRLIRQPWFEAVKGNHECMAIDGMIGDDEYIRELWFLNAGDWFLSLSEDMREDTLNLIKLSAELPFVIELNDNNFKTVIAHADYPYNEYKFGLPLEQQQVVWERSRVEEGDKSVIKGADIFIFGHTPMKEVTQMGNRLYIDTGAVFNGNLSILKLK